MRFFRNSIGKYSCLVALAIMGPLLAGCWTQKPKLDPHAAPTQSTADTNQAQFGPLRIGDAIRVDFSGTPNTIPFVETEIKGDGMIHFEFIEIGSAEIDGQR